MVKMNRVVKSGETAESDNGNQSALSLNIEAGNHEIAISIQTDSEPEDDRRPRKGDQNKMLKAANEGDWATAEMLLKRFKSFAWDMLSRDGERALHEAVKGKHTEFVRELVKWLKPEELSLTDGDYGYTACSYAAMDGTLELARILVEANPSVVTARDDEGRTPLRLAFSHRKIEISEYFLSVVAFDDSMKEELFACLLEAINIKRLDLALKILEKNIKKLALMKDRWNRTALHVLAKLDMSRGWKIGDPEKHTEFVCEILKRLTPEELSLTDGGHTAYSYAAMDGTLELARILVEANPSFITARDGKGSTPLRLAFSHRKIEISEYFLSVVAFDDSMKEELFACLLEAINIKRLDLALKILEKNIKKLALMKDRWNRTALHVLAKLDMSRGWKIGDPEKHTEFVCEILKRLTPEELSLTDGGHTAYSYAAMDGTLELARILVEANPSFIAARDYEGRTPLRLAFSHGRIKIFEYFLSVVKFDDSTKEGLFACLLEAINIKRLDVALQILEKNIEKLALMKDRWFRTALHVLAQLDMSEGWKIGDPRKHTEFVREILERLKPEESLTDGGYPACSYAAMDGTLELARILVETNPSVITAQDYDGRTPLRLAFSHGKIEISEYFLSVVTFDDSTKEDLFHCWQDAIDAKRPDVALQILEKYIEKQALMKDRRGRTALHVLAQLDMSEGWKHTEFVHKILKQLKPEESLTDGGYPACSYAAIDGTPELARILVKANPSVITARDNEGRTPLRLALSHGKIEIFEYFLSVITFDDSTKEELFACLLGVINKKRLDLALKILKKDIVSLALMKDGWGRTALHVLAQLDESKGWEIGDPGKDSEFVSELEESSLTGAAMNGILELARILLEANPSVITARDDQGRTPLTLAFAYGNMVIFENFLRAVTFDDSTKEELLASLLEVIKKERLDRALKILEKDTVSLALMKDHRGRTALHVLAQVDMSRGWKIGDPRKLQDDFDLLAKRLWEGITAAASDKGLELVKSTIAFYDQATDDEKRYSILHDAAEVGNLSLINMITDDFPHLLSHPDKEGCPVLHRIVMYQRETNIIFELLGKAKDVKDGSEIPLDKEGNNILHEAAKSRFPEGLEVVAEQDIEMQKAFLWFKAVEKIVPPKYGEMGNKQGYLPIQLIWKEHGKMLATSEAYLKKTAESSMLISTIVLTLVFAAAFAPPGGFNQDTGIPMFLKNKWFTSFTVFQLLALCSSTVSIIGFWSIISSQTKEYQFFVWLNYLRLGMCALLLSVLFVISAFLSAFLLVFAQEREALAMSFIIPIYISFFVVIFYQVLKVLRKTSRHSLMDPSSSKFNTLRGRVSSFVASLVSFFHSGSPNS